uniref:HMG-box domain-containing protein n=1 Tax=Salmonella sp. s54395 TaxID=3159664 RepID=UPI00397F8C71
MHQRGTCVHFFLYSNDERAAVRANHADWNVGMVAKKLSEQWKVLDPERKAKYDRGVI